MNDEGQPLTAEHVFKQTIWRSTLATGAAMEQFTTWTVTGIAAIVVLLVSNIESVSKIISHCGLKAGIVLLTVSLLAGVISKQIGMAVANGLETVNRLEALLHSQGGKRLMAGMSSEPRQLMRELSEPFLWPISILVRQGGELGVTDYTATEKRLIRQFCVQLYFYVIHALLAVAALMTLALSIHS